MSERGEEFAEKIEQNIREAVERMVSDMRSSLEDVREAVVQQLDAASQSVQADAKALSLRSQIDQILQGVEDVSAPAASPAAPPRADSGRLRSAVRAVEQGKSQVDVLNALLEQALQFSSRAALFILKGDSFAGWKGAGFAAHGGNDESIKRFTASGNDLPDLGSLLGDERVVSTGGAVAARLGVSTPAEALLIPMVIKDKVAAAIYVDAVQGEEGAFDRAALELLVFTTGLLIDTLAIRKKLPSPTLSADDDEPTLLASAQPAPSQARKPAAETAPPPSAGPRTMVMPQVPPVPPRETPPPPVAREEAPKAEPDREPVKRPSFELESEQKETYQFSDFATTAIPSPAAPEPPPPPPPPPAPKPEEKPPAKPAGASGAPEVEKPTTQYIPPPGVTGARFGSQQPQTAETKKHDEAKRFARLLVSEIKLYNEAKVDEGRKHRDLYDRMKEDIDRSRQMYDERIPDEVRRGSNYFYDELVRILGDGNPDLLGL